MLACKRVPNGIVCLKSAVRFHGLLPVDSVKAKKPVASGLKLSTCGLRTSLSALF